SNAMLEPPMAAANRKIGGYPSALTGWRRIARSWLNRRPCGGSRGVGAGDENRRQVSAGCQYGWRWSPSRSMEESGVLEMKLHCRILLGPTSLGSTYSTT